VVSLDFSATERGHFRHCAHYRVRYADIDSLRHVNNKAYLAYIEDARLDYLRQVAGLDTQKLNLTHVIVRIDIQFVSPMYLGDAADVYQRCTRIGNKSIDLESILIRRAGGAGGTEIVAARALTTIANIDPETGRAVPVQDTLTRKIEAYEPSAPEQRARSN